MKKAIVVALNINDLVWNKREKATKDALGELNQHLADGWNVVHTFPMSGTGNQVFSSSIVVLEKD